MFIVLTVAESTIVALPLVSSAARFAWKLVPAIATLIAAAGGVPQVALDRDVVVGDVPVEAERLLGRGLYPDLLHLDLDLFGRHVEELNNTLQILDGIRIPPNDERVIQRKRVDARDVLRHQATALSQRAVGAAQTAGAAHAADAARLPTEATHAAETARLPAEAAECLAGASAVKRPARRLRERGRRNIVPRVPSKVPGTTSSSFRLRRLLRLFGTTRFLEVRVEFTSISLTIVGSVYCKSDLQRTLRCAVSRVNNAAAVEGASSAL